MKILNFSLRRSEFGFDDKVELEDVDIKKASKEGWVKVTGRVPRNIKDGKYYVKAELLGKDWLESYKFPITH